MINGNSNLKEIALRLFTSEEDEREDTPNAVRTYQQDDETSSNRNGGFIAP
jgi:hypothetical protein